MMRGSDPERLWSDRMVLFRGLFVFLPQKKHFFPTFTREVFEDYRSQELMLRQHLRAFLHVELREHRTRSCADRYRVGGGQGVTVTGLVLMRELPGYSVEASAIRYATSFGAT